MAQFPSTTSASDVWNVTDVYRAVAGGNWPSPPAPATPDPYFPYVTMLLPGNGTNGAQNNTFLDSGPNTYTITRSGNTTQGTFSPYGSNWSTFVKEGAYLSVPNNAVFNPGSGDFTVEAMFVRTNNTGGSQTIIAKYETGWQASYSIVIADNTWDVYITYGVGSYALVYSGAAPAVGVWSHVALQRSGSYWEFYCNGVRLAQVTAYTIASTTSAIRIGELGAGYSGYSFYGNISNVRIRNGYATYSGSTYTVPTANLTAITGTVLLTCQSNRFIDNSSNNFTVTAGTVSTALPSVQRFNPFSPAASYSTSVIGGSGYFDGTGDYLTTPDNAAWDLGSNNFTIESWVYPTASPAQPMIIGQWTSSYSWTMQLSNDGNRYLRALLYNGSFNDYVSSTSLQLNAWNHCAFVRESNTVSLYLNGARVYTTTFSGSVSTSSSAVSVGGDASGSQPYQGYLSNISVVNGTALYSGTTYTIPTAPSSVVANTKLLLSTINAGIIDNAMMNNLETVGNAQISTSVSKFGGGSMAFDGTGDYLSGPTTPTTALGSGAYTVEFWLYKDSTGTGERGIFQTQTASLYGLSIFADGTTIYIDERTNSFNGSDPRISGTISQDTWIHVAVCRQTGTSGTLRVFVNGTQIGSSVTSNLRNLTSTGPIIVGNTAVATNPLKGYIDDLRITNGYARYTSNFTAPTAAFPTF